MIEKLIPAVITVVLPEALRRLGVAQWLIDGLVAVAKDVAPVAVEVLREKLAGGALPELRVPREPGDWKILDEELQRALAADTTPPSSVPPTER